MSFKCLLIRPPSRLTYRVPREEPEKEEEASKEESSEAEVEKMKEEMAVKEDAKEEEEPIYNRFGKILRKGRGS